MSALGGREIIAKELREAVARLQEDIARVEFWTDALGGFSKPIPDYDAAEMRLNEFVLPAASRRDPDRNRRLTGPID